MVDTTKAAEEANATATGSALGGALDALQSIVNAAPQNGIGSTSNGELGAIVQAAATPATVTTITQAQTAIRQLQTAVGMLATAALQARQRQGLLALALRRLIRRALDLFSDGSD